MKTTLIGTIVILAFAGGLDAKEGECKGGNGERFANLDANSDGVVSKEECAAAPKGGDQHVAHKGGHGKGKHGGKGKGRHGKGGDEGDL